MSVGAAGAMGRRAFEWIVRHADRFFAIDDGERVELKRLKYASELALIAGTLIEEMPEGRELVARAWQQVDGGERISRALDKWPVAATTYLPFRLAGWRSLELENSLGERAWLSRHETLPPFARFAIGIVLEMVAVAPPWNEVETVLANQFFARPTQKTPAVRAEILAHAVMWRSAMGRNRAGLGHKATMLYREVSADWHRVLLEGGLWEPLGEIIIADVCSGGIPPPNSLEKLCAAQHDDGAMPPRLGYAATTFEDLYHTTCVAALAGTLSTRGANSVTSSPEEAPRDVERISVVLKDS
jgi:hypothetical protein